MHPPKHLRGFSFIEIIIVLAMIAIMSHWMLGSYQGFIAAAKRREAENTLLTLASALEDYAVQRGSYSGATLRKLHLSALAANHDYEFKIIHADHHAYLIAALPVNRQALIDDQCGTLYLTAAGEKRVSGKTSAAHCW
jgi:prepilin-type N-terminal cleavage/methylation domain-containing protein